MLRLKAEAFDRLADRYRILQTEAGFYSRNWVEIEQLIKAALENLRFLEQSDEGPDSSSPG